jgi:hypothetical protein
MEGFTVSVRVNGDGFDVQLPAHPDDADCNLSSIGD